MARRMRVLSYAPNPDDRRIQRIDSVEQLPYIEGPGGENHVCGFCGLVLLRQVAEGQVDNTILRCPGCGAHNAT